jgi:hypothetical protein
VRIWGLLLRGRLLIRILPLMGGGPAEYIFVSPHIRTVIINGHVWAEVRVGEIGVCVMCVCVLCVGVCVCVVCECVCMCVCVWVCVSCV